MLQEKDNVIVKKDNVIIKQKDSIVEKDNVIIKQKDSIVELKQMIQQQSDQLNKFKKQSNKNFKTVIKDNKKTHYKLDGLTTTATKIAKNQVVPSKYDEDDHYIIILDLFNNKLAHYYVLRIQLKSLSARLCKLKRKHKKLEIIFKAKDPNSMNFWNRLRDDLITNGSIEISHNTFRIMPGYSRRQLFKAIEQQQCEKYKDLIEYVKEYTDDDNTDIESGTDSETDSETDNETDNESGGESDNNAFVKKSAKKPLIKQKKPIALFSDSESDDEIIEKKPIKKTVMQPKKKHVVLCSDSESDDESDIIINKKPTKKAIKRSKKKHVIEYSDTESDDESDDE